MSESLRLKENELNMVKIDFNSTNSTLDKKETDQNKLKNKYKNIKKVLND